MYTTQYILAFSNDLDELYEVYFGYLNPLQAPGRDIAVVPVKLTGTDDCLTIRSTARDDDKKSYILGTECLIAIWVSKNLEIDITDFIAEYDQDILITVYKDQDYDTCVFQGFVVVEDNSQPFLDPPFVLNIRALDGLGMLKQVYMLDLEGNQFSGSMSIIAWIAQILYKTGQTLPIRVYYNIFYGTANQNICSLLQVFLNAYCFNHTTINPNDINPVDIFTQEDDCLTALTKIIRCLRARIFVEDGHWMIVGLYEYLNPNGTAYVEFTMGSPIGPIVPVSASGVAKNLLYDVRVGKNSLIIPFNEDAILYLKLATRSIELQYDYNQADNKITNQLFQETGPANRLPQYDEQLKESVIDPTLQLQLGNPPLQRNDDLEINTQAYAVAGWNSGQAPNTSVANPAVLPASPLSSAGFIRVVLDSLNDEYERFLVIQAVDGSYTGFMQSSSFLIDINDRLVISVDVRTLGVISGSVLFGFPFAIVLMKGIDGSFWALSGIEGDNVTNQTANEATWVPVNSNYQNSQGNIPYCSWLLSSQTNTRVWFTAKSGGFFPSVAPVSGTCYLYLLCALPAGEETWYKNLSIEITPFLQGSYVAVLGDFNYANSNNNILQTFDEQVEISDSPKRYFKGALLQADGESLIIPNWSRAGFTDNLRFTQMMTTILFNHLYRRLQKIEGTFKGLIYLDNQDISDIRVNGFLNSYLFVDSKNPDKKYMLTSFEKHYATGQWRGVFVETLQDANDSGFIIPGTPGSNSTFEFQYLLGT